MIRFRCYRCGIPVHLRLQEAMREPGEIYCSSRCERLTAIYAGRGLA